MTRDEIGHIDQTMRATGTVRVGGKDYSFDAPTNRDHSWSPRPEYGHGRGNFDEAYFGTDMLFHAQTSEADDGSHRITNGYLVDHGEVVLFKAGEARVKRDGIHVTDLLYEVEDVRGRTHVFRGTPINSTPLPTFPNQFNSAGLTAWTYDGEQGLGEYKWHWEVSELIAQ